MTLIVGLDAAKALWFAAEGLPAVNIGVVVHLDERFERQSQQLAIIQHAAVVIRNSPRPRVDIKTGVEAALLSSAAQFGVAVAAAQSPVAAAGAIVVLEHLHPVAGLAQLVGGHHARDAGPEHQ